MTKILKDQLALKGGDLFDSIGANIDLEEDFESIRLSLSEDLFHIKYYLDNVVFVIDAGWYENDDKTGEFRVVVVSDTVEGWFEPIYSGECHSLEDLIYMVNMSVSIVFDQK